MRNQTSLRDFVYLIYYALYIINNIQIYKMQAVPPRDKIHSLPQYYPARTGSPGLILREYGRPAEDVSRIYTYSYLTETPSQGYLRRPIQPYDKPPTSPHFHRPSCKFSKYLI